MAKEKTGRALKKGGAKSGVKRSPAGSVSRKPPTPELYDKLRKNLSEFSRDKEKAFKNSERWEYLRKGLLDAASCGLKHFAVKTTDKEFGEGKVYAEWEIDSFVCEYGFLYYYCENRWRIYWF